MRLLVTTDRTEDAVSCIGGSAIAGLRRAR
jgi:hypothetical protein